MSGKNTASALAARVGISDSEDIAGTKPASGRFRFFKRHGPDHQGLIRQQTSGGFLPRIWRQPHLLGAEPRQQLLAAPAGLTPHLRKKSAGARLTGEINSIVERIKIQRRRRWLHR